MVRAQKLQLEVVIAALAQQEIDRQRDLAQKELDRLQLEANSGICCTYRKHTSHKMNQLDRENEKVVGA